MAYQLLLDPETIRVRLPVNFDRCAFARAQIRHLILKYLYENPDSSDTVEGITWWLIDRWIKEYGPYVEAVILEFLDEGLLLKYQAADKRDHYRLNPQKRKDLRRIITPDINLNQEHPSLCKEEE